MKNCASTKGNPISKLDRFAVVLLCAALLICFMILFNFKVDSVAIEDMSACLYRLIRF